ncbi:hypothetical protein AVEN_58620-1 [Araneus ventricosus]|uniref:THAP-type domain-containing protein n=1 Tax=Araneus ventricosus TaxID=182803 RepID=A0A4Y1ZKY5_ARAVE|nr:hypothetical protein AVEN_58620-1 [Araneus ventricosus]
MWDLCLSPPDGAATHTYCYSTSLRTGERVEIDKQALGTGDMDVNAENVGYRKMKFSKRTCSVCETPGSKLFRIPLNENVEDIQSTSSDNFSALPSAAFQGTSVEVCEVEPLCSESMDAEPSGSESVMDAEPSCSESFMFSPTSSHNISSHLQVTPKTKKIKNLRSSVSKLKKKLYEKRTSSRFLGQLQAKLADKPQLYNFVTSQLRMQCKDSKGRRWSAKEKTFALQIYLHSPSAYQLLRKYFAFPSKATLHRYTYNIAKSPGFCKNLVKCLKSQTSRMSESNRLCVLLLDEMSIIYINQD